MKHFLCYVRLCYITVILQSHGPQDSLPPSVRLTNDECAHLVMCRYFHSHDKDSGPAIQYAVAVNPMLHANVMALCFIQAELWLIKVLHC